MNCFKILMECVEFYVNFYIATDVGANIQIGTCNGDDTQIWVYEQDGTMKLI